MVSFVLSLSDMLPLYHGYHKAVVISNQRLRESLVQSNFIFHYILF